MKNEWENSGKCAEAMLSEKIDSLSAAEYEYMIAFYTDRFSADIFTPELADKADFRKLLEIRIFGEKKEFLARRTMIGAKHPFQYREAFETEEMKRTGKYLVKYQTLDIDRETVSKISDHKISLRSTGGGKYELPFTTDMDSIRVISYVDYDKDGMAFIYDHRLAGFVKREEHKDV